MCVYIIRNWLTQFWRLINPQICSWKAGDSADGILPAHVLGTKIQESQFSPNAIRLETQEELMFLCKFKDKKKVFVSNESV